MVYFVERHMIVSQPDAAVEEVDRSSTPPVLTRRLACGWFEDEARAQRLAERLAEQTTFWGYSVTDAEPDGPAYAGRDRIYVIVEHEVDGIFTLSTGEGYFTRFTDAELRCEELTTRANKQFPPRVEMLQEAPDDPGTNENDEEAADE